MDRFTMKTADLSEGEVHCDECEGTGWCRNDTSFIGYDTCLKCYGTGKFDWVENICGKQESFVGIIDYSRGGLKITLPPIMEGSKFKIDWDKIKKSTTEISSIPIKFLTVEDNGDKQKL